MKSGAISSTIVDDKDYEVHIIGLLILKEKIPKKKAIGKKNKENNN
jgi:hypothetical protein